MRHRHGALDPRIHGQGMVEVQRLDDDDGIEQGDGNGTQQGAADP
jgi:hypothetical protein